MRAFSLPYKRFMIAVFAVFALAASGNITALAQGTESSRELERVDINPPDRRPAARATSEAAPRYTGDQTNSPDSSSSSGPESAAVFGNGNSAAASTLSLVTGKSTVSIGAPALPAQVQTITPQDIQQLNIWGREPADLFIRTAGINAYYYNQGTLGLGIGMRGFATANDIGFWVDGVPQNYPSEVGQGRVVLQWLTPEAIERIEVIKGPFSAMYGNFAEAGVINIVTKKSAPSSSVTAEGGSFGAFRGLAILSSQNLVPTPFLVQDYYDINGYRENSQLKQGTTFDKFSVPIVGGILSLRYSYFQSDWGGAGYVPVNQVKSGQWPRKQALDPWDGGWVRRSELVANYAPACGERGLYADLYMHRYDGIRWRKLWPTTNSEYAVYEGRPYWGGRAYYNLVFGDVASLTVGGDTRQDTGSEQRYNTIRRVRSAPDTFGYELSLTNWGMFLQGQIKPHEKAKIVGGLRWDYFTQQFDNQTRPQNSGKQQLWVSSPKVGFVMTPTENFNIFGNAGMGFRTPAFTEVSPYQAGKNANFGLECPAVRTYDIGANATLFGSLYLAADYYHTYMERELVTIASESFNVGNTVRKGYELEAKYYPSKNLDFFASYAWVDAKVVDPTNPGQFLVPYIPEHLIKAGVTIGRDFGPYGNILADLYYQYFSGPPLYNGTVTTPLYAPDYDVYNFKLRYTGNGWSSFFSARCQPREYSASYFSNTGALLTYDPPPQWELNAGLMYSFY
ncbi:TonB-dependent receptor [Desulfomonile tiedjei]|uniref:Outer membrane receptor for ferrienterochelin and colicins n=1 Tax=Desulfomonile tiedjei (strain ATCC 49306 / DSM 6799 / DCB-1) TaxID=706587 RepID=I4CDW0_DESTA|nr:TonB-dependent receptor [Desulfomonile tiedjei]AFM27751.1 outer membrane receptor for ferrienterochelin and colicins [Desulfomonile tiedjei DSM 6799]